MSPDLSVAVPSPLASLAALAGLWLAIALASALALHLLWPAFERRLARAAPEPRARVAWLAATLPVALPSAIVLLCALPGLAGFLSGAGDHCLGHGDHPHFCPVHATLSMSPPLAVAIAAFAAVSIALARRAVPALRALVREGRWLARRRGRRLAPDVRLLDAPIPLALTHGFVRPAIWLTPALLDPLAEDERAVVIAHERAHVARRDPARFLIASLASVLLGPRLRARILDALRLASEQACDLIAADVVGDRLRVAETLVHVERLMTRAPRPLGTAAALVDSGLRARVAALLAPDPRRPARIATRPLPIPTAWILAAAALLLASPVHHLAEHLLEGLLRSLVGLHDHF